MFCNLLQWSDQLQNTVIELQSRLTRYTTAGFFSIPYNFILFHLIIQESRFNLIKKPSFIHVLVLRMGILKII